MRGSGPIAAMSSSASPRQLRERTLAVGYAQRGVARVGQLARAVHELLQDRLDGVLGGDRQHRVAERVQPRARRGHGRTVPGVYCRNSGVPSKTAR